MFNEKKKVSAEEVEKKNANKEIPEEHLDEVAGGKGFSNIPRVPEKPIDGGLKGKI